MSPILNAKENLHLEIINFNAITYIRGRPHVTPVVGHTDICNNTVFKHFTHIMLKSAVNIVGNLCV